MKKLIMLIVATVLLSLGCGSSVSETLTPNTGNGQEVPARSSNMMYLTVPEMKRVDHLPVYSGDNDEYEKLLRKSALHVESTGYPWQNNRNVYIAGHRLGFENTKSWLVFEDIDELRIGDRIIIQDDTGKKYEYAMYKREIVSPNQLSVLEPKPGLDTVTLQSCTYPAYADRILVVGKRVN